MEKFYNIQRVREEIPTEPIPEEVCYILKSPDGKEPVCFTMDYKLIEEGNPRREADHGAGIETSMMLYLAGERVNMKANDGHARPDLGLMGSFPFHEASAEEGEIRFNLQVEGLVRLARERLQRLHGDENLFT